MRSFQGWADRNRLDTLTLQQRNEPNDADDDQIHGHKVIQESGRNQNEYASQQGDGRCYDGIG